jgi:pimeloyl-ACP methyl ester carboxylesterase
MVANKNYRVCIMAAAAWVLLAVFAPPASRAAEPVLEFTTVAGAAGVPLNVVTTGARTGRPVVFVHGIGQSYLAFENQLRSSLGRNLFLVAFDLRGHGNSGKPWSPEAYSDRSIWAQDLDSVIRALGLRDPLLVGWSYGTLVVLDYVRVHGTQGIGGIVLTGAYGGLTLPDTRQPPPPPDPKYARLRDDLASADLERKWRAAHAMAAYLTARPMPAPWIERAAALSLLLPQTARVGMYRQPFDNTDLIPVLQTVPMLVMIGGKDASAHEAEGRQLVAALPRARLEMYPADGHSVFIESPERFNRELSRFAASLTPVAVRKQP